MFAYFKNRHAVTIDPLSFILLAVLVGGGYFLFLIRDILVLLFLAFILTVALNPLVAILQRKLKVPKPVAIAISYLVLVSSVVLFIGLVIPPLAHQFIGFIQKLSLPGFSDYFTDINFTLQEMSTLVSRVGESASVVVTIINSAFNSVFTFVTLFVLSFYLMLERGKLHTKIGWFTQDKKVIAQFEHFLNEAERQLGGWVRAQSVLMLVVGVVTFIGLSLLQIPYALALGLTAGIFEILPNLGPLISAVPAVVIAYVTFGPISAGVVALFYIIVQQLENNILVPKIIAASANVNPLISIVAILIGLKIGGMIGALLAIPVYVVARLTYSTFFMPGRHAQS